MEEDDNDNEEDYIPPGSPFTGARQREPRERLPFSLLNASHQERIPAVTPNQSRRPLQISRTGQDTIGINELLPIVS